MFESTLEAQGLNDGERRVGSMSVAIFAHLGIITAIAGATAIIVPSVKIPEPRIVVPILARDIVLAPPPVPEPHGGGGGNRRNAIAPPIAPPIEPPQITPDKLPPAAQDPPEEGVPGPEDGPVGVGAGLTGSGGPEDGDGGPGPGHGTGGDPQYITADIDKPVLISKVEPEYPFAARRIGLGGRVTVSAVIGLEGSVESAEILGSTNSLFDQAALDAVRKWRYRPATMNGQPVRVFFTVRVDFVVR